MTSTYVLDTQQAKSEFGAHGSSTTRVNNSGFPPSLRSDSSQLEAGIYNDTAPCVPRTAATGNGVSRLWDERGMAIDQEIALANLDPRTRHLKSGQSNKRMGVSTSAVADEPSRNVPNQGIEVSRDWRLDSE